MKTLEIQGTTGRSRIMVGESLEHLASHIPVEQCVIITDENVGRIYGKDFPPCPVIEIPVGEKIKNLDTLQYVYGKLLDLEVDRSVFIAGVGGGIVCDMAGFAASTYLRGLRFGFVSTTLLAQVDASVGGKNGVNFRGYKNLIGSFNQPEFVICDMNLLRTLPKREVLCGFGEIAKHAFIGDVAMCGFLEKNYKKALALDPEVIARLVYDSVVIKSNIVNRDEREAGERKKLNFGHTFGHAIEKTTDTLRHGEAISVGMVVAAKLSVERDLLPGQDAKRIETLLGLLELPVTLTTDKKQMINAIKRDKKREGGHIDFVLLEGIGRAVLEKISIKELEDVVFAL